jgi:hypothetical protein
MDARWQTWTTHIKTVFHQLKKRRWPAFFRQSTTGLARGTAR